MGQLTPPREGAALLSPLPPPPSLLSHTHTILTHLTFFFITHTNTPFSFPPLILSPSSPFHTHIHPLTHLTSPLPIIVPIILILSPPFSPPLSYKYLIFHTHTHIHFFLIPFSLPCKHSSLIITSIAFLLNHLSLTHTLTCTILTTFTLTHSLLLLLHLILYPSPKHPHPHPHTHNHAFLPA